MSDHTSSHEHPNGDTASPRQVERYCDVAVIGGSAAGLAAALQISRQRWSVIVVDAGEPVTPRPPTCTATSATRTRPPT
ncbi:MAG: FAD-binding protein [Acidimicrobiales bacterium]